MATEKRLIYANELVDTIYKSDEMLHSDEWETNEIVDQIDRIPTVDAVEVVRCKDCRHFWESFSGTHSCKLHKGLVGTKYDAFCSYGERKDNEN